MRLAKRELLVRLLIAALRIVVHGVVTAEIGARSCYLAVLVVVIGRVECLSALLGEVLACTR